MIRIKTGQEFTEHACSHFEIGYAVNHENAPVLGGVFDSGDTGEQVVVYQFLHTGEVFISTYASQDLFQTESYKRRGHVVVVTGSTGREMFFKEVVSRCI